MGADRLTIPLLFLTKPVENMRISRSLPTFAALVAMASVSSFAEDKPEAKAPESAAAATPAAPGAKPEKPKLTPEERFKKMDANNDGALSLEEFLGKAKPEAKAAKEEEFKKLDTDGNGSLSLEEFVARGKKKKDK